MFHFLIMLGVLAVTVPMTCEAEYYSETVRAIMQADAANMDRIRAEARHTEEVRRLQRMQERAIDKNQPEVFHSLQNQIDRVERRNAPELSALKARAAGADAAADHMMKGLPNSNKTNPSPTRDTTIPWEPGWGVGGAGRVYWPPRNGNSYFVPYRYPGGGGVPLQRGGN